MTFYIGFAFPFSKGPSQFPQTAVDNALIKQALTQLILTGRGERIMRPDVGSGAYSFIFEPNRDVSKQLIRAEINQVVAKYEPRVAIQFVDVVFGDPNNPDTATDVTITVNYVVLATRTQQTLEMNLATGGGP